MRRRVVPQQGPPPLERATVARLVVEIAERKGTWHTEAGGRAALDELCELVGSPMPAYFVMMAVQNPGGPRPVDEMVEHIMAMAPRWAGGSE